jgi:hypothetical protein
MVSPLAFALVATALAGCGSSDGPPPVEATTTATVKNEKAQPAHDSQIARLDDDRLTALFSGQELDGHTPDGRRWTAAFATVGSADIEWSGPDGSGSDVGAWKIEDETACMQWQTLMDGQENCMAVYDVGNDQYNMFNDNGSMNAVITPR